MRPLPRLTLLLALAGGLLPAFAVADESLQIGDPAPKLALSKWIKGEKFDGFEPGKTYVLEFWATWCGPCVAAMPHLTELAHKYKDKGVRFVGVDVLEDDVAGVEKLVKEVGDKMDYAVAIDSIPKGGNPKTGGSMAQDWLIAAGEQGIPTTFVVHNGKIAWIGHPMKLDKPLAGIVAGDWDLKAASAQRDKDSADMRRFLAHQGTIFAPYRKKDYKATLAAIDSVIADDPGAADTFAAMKFNCLAKTGEVDKALEVGKMLAEKSDNDAQALNAIAWDIVDSDLKEMPDPGLARFALKLARRADALTKGEDPALLDTLAAAFFRTGDPAAALEAEEKAIKLLGSGESGKNGDMAEQMRKRAEAYRKAAAKP